MCGRFGFEKPVELRATGPLYDTLRPDVVADGVAELLVPRYNIAPSQPVVVARTRVRGGRAERRLGVARWGLIPSWAKDPNAPGVGARLANARAETVAERASFRGAWRAGRRCLIFADLFYEWRDVADAPERPKPAKQPYAVRLADDAPFAFAGLWEAWRAPAAAGGGASWVPTCTLITTRPNALLRPIHDRMPVIVPREKYDAWLDPELPLERAAALLAPYAARGMHAYPVTRRVNDPGRDDASVLEPAEDAA